jgi:hypothetical protein
MWTIKPLKGKYKYTILENTKTGATAKVVASQFSNSVLNGPSEREQLLQKLEPKRKMLKFENQGTYQLAREILYTLNKTRG